MTRITRITTQKKSKNRFNIFLDNGQEEVYGFSVDEAVLIENKLRKGLELDNTMINTLIQKDTLHKSYTLAINFLSYRMRTMKEINDYLVKKEIEPEHIPVIIERLTKENLLDDKMFADAFVKTRIHTSSKGPMLVKKELIEKGVSAAIASEAILQYSYDIQTEKAQKWVNKKLTINSKHSFRKQLQQLQATLIQKGFAQDVIKDVLNGVQDVKDADAEWDALVHQGDKLLRKHQAKFEGYELRNKMKEVLYRKGFTIELINKFLDEHIDR
ncbi:recombination regulator RecX [Virgibacillus oceani]|uniref:Regulatory protein RecX n=1 Tax=Virgibacillus oceani TaxID=1479511 RepID=A0A917HQJ3_9BACI|nr:recombination regulator RecX [Virgibacillus oceani]GGG87410.1 regulatory protein RecX [Virgibacillus oceani]